MHMSKARSHACQSGCSFVAGSGGCETGVQSSDFMIRSASRKLRNSEATRRSCRKSFYYCGNFVYENLYVKFLCTVI